MTQRRNPFRAPSRSHDIQEIPSDAWAWGLPPARDPVRPVRSSQEKIRLPLPLVLNLWAALLGRLVVLSLIGMLVLYVFTGWSPMRALDSWSGSYKSPVQEVQQDPTKGVPGRKAVKPVLREDAVDVDSLWPKDTKTKPGG